MSKTFRFDTAACKACTTRALSKDSQVPCIEAHETADKRKRPQLRFYWDNEIGRRCPAIGTWPEIYGFAYNKYGGWDGNQLSLSYVPAIKQKAVPSRFDAGTDMTKSFVGDACDYKWDETTQRYLYKLAEQNYAAIVGFPNDHYWRGFLEEVYYPKVAPNPETTWIGFCDKLGAGIGMGGKTGSGGSDVVFGRFANYGAMKKGTQQWWGFNALITRNSVYGADATLGLNLVYITGLEKAQDLNGYRFSGSDLNLALIGNLKAASKAEHLPKLAKIGKIIMGGAKTVDDAHLEDLVNWSRRLQSGYDAGQNKKGISLSMIDAGLGGGLAVSWTTWEGVVSSVI